VPDGKRAAMVLRGRRIGLRAVESDVEREIWRGWINRPDVMEGMDRAVVASAAEHRRYVDEAVAASLAVFYGIEPLEQPQLVGIVWLWDVDRLGGRAEVRIVIGAPAARGRGYGTDALDVVAADAFGRLGLRELYAYVHAGNEASRRAFERAGFALEATLQREARRDGREVDVHRLSRFKH